MIGSLKRAEFHFHHELESVGSLFGAYSMCHYHRKSTFGGGQVFHPLRLHSCLRFACHPRFIISCPHGLILLVYICVQPV